MSEIEPALKAKQTISRIAVLGSGNGGNYQALQDAGLPIALVLSDCPDAYILTRAERAGVPTAIARSSQDILHTLRGHEIDFVCLAGFMRLIRDPLLSAFSDRILNIHPSLLPAFPGLEAWTQALEARVSETGCTVHYVDAGMDTGKVIAQAKVPVLSSDTASTLHQRIQAAEHQLYPSTVKRLLAL